MFGVDDAIMAGSQALTGVISGITALTQSAKAKKLERQNPRPIKEVSPEIQANVELAKQQANIGMPAQQYAQQQKAIKENQAVAAGTAGTQRGGALAAAGALQAGSNNAMGNLNAESASMQMQNIQNLMHQNQILSGEKEKAWQWNSQMKYEENAAAIRALRSSANANFGQAAAGLGGAAASAASSGLFGGSKPAPQTSQQQFDSGTGINQWLSQRPTIDQSLIPKTSLNVNPTSLMDFGSEAATAGSFLF